MVDRDEIVAVAREVGREVGREVAAVLAANMAAPAPGLLPPDELAMALRVSRKTIVKLGRDGLPSQKVAGLIRYDLEEVKAWLKSRPLTEKETTEQPPKRLGRGRR